MLLVDCKGQAPDKVLRSIPHFLTAIVFRDGQYGHGLPVQMEAQYLHVWGKKGQVPAPYAFYVRGGSAYAKLQQAKADVERFQKMTELQVEADPPAGVGGGWRAKLTPAAGHTLLEVFLLTGAGFNLVDR